MPVHTVTIALSFVDSDHRLIRSVLFKNVNIPKLEDIVLSDFARKTHILIDWLTVAFLQCNLPLEFPATEYK